jgi:hypothetical protein
MQIQDRGDAADPVATFTHALAAFVKAEIARQIAALRPTTHADMHTATEPPAGMSRRAFVEAAPTIPGARKHGRVWVVPRAAFDSWAASRSKRRALATPPANDAPWAPEIAIAAAGLRPVRKVG